MSPIYLDSLDEFMLARIVKKFNSVHTGANFYRSCRGARDFVDRVRPVWPLPQLRLHYDRNRKGVCAERYNGRALSLEGTPQGTWGEMQVLGKSLPPLEWCRIEVLTLGSCSDNYFKEVLVPEIKAMGAVTSLSVGPKLSEEQMQQLMAAAKPEVVFLSLYKDDITSIAFKDVKNLHVRADDRHKEVEAFWKSKKMFGLMASRKTITWRMYFRSWECIVPFLQNWLKGELTGSCEKLTIQLWHEDVQLEEMEKMLNEPEIQNLSKSCAKLPNGYILERKTGGQLRISIDSIFIPPSIASIQSAPTARPIKKIDFSFS